MHEEILADCAITELHLHNLMATFDASQSGLMLCPWNDQTIIEKILMDYEADARISVAARLAQEQTNEILEQERALVNAFILAGYSKFEFGLMRIAEHYLVQSNSRLRWRDFRDSGFRRFELIAEKVASIEMSFDVDWKLLPFYSTIRNQIAHSNGLCFKPDDRDKLCKATAAVGHCRVKHIEEISAWEVVAEPMFVRRMIERFIVILNSAKAKLLVAHPC